MTRSDSPPSPCRCRPGRRRRHRPGCGEHRFGCACYSAGAGDGATGRGHYRHARTAADIARIDAAAAAGRQRTGQQTAVLVTKTTGGDLEGYSLSVARAWGVGDKAASNGVLILVATEDRKLRIEVGRGLEGDIPDAVASRIINNDMVPKMRSGDVSGAVLAAVNAVQLAQSKPTPVAASDDDTAADVWALVWPVTTVGLGVTVGMVIIRIGWNRVRRGSRRTISEPPASASPLTMARTRTTHSAVQAAKTAAGTAAAATATALAAADAARARRRREEQARRSRSSSSSDYGSSNSYSSGSWSGSSSFDSGSSSFGGGGFDGGGASGSY